MLGHLCDAALDLGSCGELAGKLCFLGGSVEWLGVDVRVDAWYADVTQMYISLRGRCT